MFNNIHLYFILEYMKAWSPRPEAAFYPLLILSGLSVGLYLLRVLVTGSGRFLFLNWNLLLAWLPLVAVWLLSGYLKTGRWLSWQAIALTVLWLSLLPNSFYLMTDLIHLKNSSHQNLLFDAVMLMSFALTGLILGLVSVFMMHKMLRLYLGRKYGWLVIQACLLLSSFAIYLGRYLGWNSWDLLINPSYILLDLTGRFTNTEDLGMTLRTTILFFCFISVTYMAFYDGLKSLKKAK